MSDSKDLGLPGIIEILSDDLGVNPKYIKPESTLEALGIDSLDQVELMDSLEFATQRDLSEVLHIDSTTTVRQLVDATQKRG